MATFLATERMNPALRARVERAVSSRTRAQKNAKKLGLSGPFAEERRPGLARILPLAALIVVVGLGTATFITGRRAFEDERASLLGAIAERRAEMPPGHEDILARVDPWITEAAADSAPPDTVSPELAEPGALDAWLGRPAMYLHAEARELRRAQGDAEAASIKDAFLLCLTAPPASASERDMLAAVRGVYFDGSKMDDMTLNVRRLTDARVGLSVVSPVFEAKVRAAEEPIGLRKLRKDFGAAPGDKAVRAAAAELLIVVADEPAGTGRRAARVALVDLTRGAPLLRARLTAAAPSSSPAAALHRAELEGCSLALAARARVEE